jgi:shikimate kinase
VIRTFAVYFAPVCLCTFGRSQSFFDNVTFTNRYNYLDVRTAGDTAADELGDGFSVSVSAEEPTAHFKSGTLDGATAAFAANGVTVTNNHGIRMPDFIGNLRVIQAWGTAGISGAIHDVSAAYFGATDLTTNGHPERD